MEKRLIEGLKIALARQNPTFSFNCANIIQKK